MPPQKSKTLPVISTLQFPQETKNVSSLENWYDVRASALSFCREWEWYKIVRKGDSKALEEKIQVEIIAGNSVDLNSKCKEEMLLTTAIKHGHADVVKILIKYGANPNAKVLRGGKAEAPLVTAMRCGFQRIVEILVGSGAQVRYDIVLLAAQNFTKDPKTFLLFLRKLPAIVNHKREKCLYNIALGSKPSNLTLRTMTAENNAANNARKLLLFALLQVGHTCECVQRKLYLLYQHRLIGPTCSELLKYQDNDQRVRVLFPQTLTLFNIAKTVVRHQILEIIRVRGRSESLHSALEKLVKDCCLPRNVVDSLLLRDCQSCDILVLRDNKSRFATAFRR